MLYDFRLANNDVLGELGEYRLNDYREKIAFRCCDDVHGFCFDLLCG